MDNNIDDLVEYVRSRLIDTIIIDLHRICVYDNLVLYNLSMYILGLS